MRRFRVSRRWRAGVVLSGQPWQGSPILAASLGGSRDWSERRERIIHLNVRSSSYKIKAIAASGGSDACISALTCKTALMHACGSAGAH